MKNEAELTLVVLECFIKYGHSLSIKDLCKKTKISQAKMKYITSVLTKRGYAVKVKNKVKNSDEYKISEKIVMLI